MPSGKKASFLKVKLCTLSDSYLRYYAFQKDHTARAKKLDLKHFIDFLTRHYLLASEKLQLEHFNTEAIQSFVQLRLEQGEAPATVARRLATIKHLGRTINEQYQDFPNPAREVLTPKKETNKPKTLSKREINSARKIAKSRVKKKTSFNRFRNQILFDLILETGMRADEIRTLLMGQISEDLQWIKNVRTKGKRYRNVYITSTLRESLREYLSFRAITLEKFFPTLAKAIDRKLPVFISTYKAQASENESFRMGSKSIWRAVNEISKDTHLHPHLLRHSFANELLNKSKDVALVAKALGHTDIRVTMRYTERGDDELAAALEKAKKEDQ